MFDDIIKIKAHVDVTDHLSQEENFNATGNNLDDKHALWAEGLHHHVDEYHNLIQRCQSPQSRKEIFLVSILF